MTFPKQVNHVPFLPILSRTETLELETHAKENDSDPDPDLELDLIEPKFDPHIPTTEYETDAEHDYIHLKNRRSILRLSRVEEKDESMTASIHTARSQSGKSQCQSSPEKNGEVGKLDSKEQKEDEKVGIQEVEVEWSEFEKNNVEVTPQDLDSSVIERISIDEQRSAANIKVTLLAVKVNVEPPIYMKFGLTFSKDYLDEQEVAGWIVTDFKLLQFGKVKEVL